MKKIMSVLLAVVIIMSLVSCSKNEESTEDNSSNNNNPIVTMTVHVNDKELAPITIELYPKVAPNTVANFIDLANQGYYDGLIFHRVIKGFMIQGGDPTGTGTGGPGYSIKGEFTNNGFKNELKHSKGVLSMARSNDPDSAGSQFFIMHEDAPHLDGDYAAFGKVVKGIESVDEIASVTTGEMDKPTQACVITKVTVDLNGYQPKKVEKIK